MSLAPQPVAFDPIFKTKPWGGRRLETLFHKRLPGNDPVGESWELVSLPDAESRVRGGPAAGKPLAELVQRWGADLHGAAALFDGRFPLLIKFLDACDHLSVQVHPKPSRPDTEWEPGIKHEAWFVLHADPGAQLYIGLRDGVGPDDVARVANTPEMVDVLETWEGRTGACYYLPSGTLHALGKGLVVAEVQTPSDVTYRAYDWGRVGLDGKPRALHIEESLANIRYDVTRDMIRQPASEVAGLVAPGRRAAACSAFTMDIVTVPGDFSAEIPRGEMAVWMLLEGQIEIEPRAGTPNASSLTSQTTRYRPGDTILLPAGGEAHHVRTKAAARWIEVRVPRG